MDESALRHEVKLALDVLSRAHDGVNTADQELVHNAISSVSKLLEQPEVLALHATAAQLIDVLLQLASCLQRAELGSPLSIAAAPSPAALLLQQLHRATAPAPLSPATPELMALVQRMGYRTADFQAAQAQMALRTAHALQQGSAASMAGCSSLLRARTASPFNPPLACLGSKAGELAAGFPGSLQQLEHPHLNKALDLLLQLAVTLPHYSPGTGRQGSLHELLAHSLLPLLRQVPLAQQQLSSRGWESYFLLEPQALQVCLAEILHAHLQANAHAASQATLPGKAPPPPSQQFQEILAQQPHWQAAVSACATNPALHLVARQALHAWLAETGNPAVWQLLVLLRQQAGSEASPAAKQGGSTAKTVGAAPVGGAAAAGERAEMMEAAAAGAGARGQEDGEVQPGITAPLGTGQGDLILPLALRVLYPEGPARNLATLLHTTAPSPERLRQAAAHLQGCKDACTALEPQSGATTTAAAPHNDTSGNGGQGHGHRTSQQLWETMLDYPQWIGFALQQLPLQQLQTTLSAGPAVPAASASAESAKAAAVYVAWLMWPHDRCRRLVSCQLLAGHHEEVELAVVQPWLQTLDGWQHMWHSME